jgi:hypothetical protein
VFFFLRKEEITTDQQRSRNKAKIHRRTLDPGVEVEDEAAVDAPLPKLPKLWIAGAHHEADGKSPTPPPKRLLPPPPSPPRRSEATTSRPSLPRSAAPRSGRGERSQGDPPISGLREVARVTAGVRGAPPPKRREVFV